MYEEQINPLTVYLLNNEDIKKIYMRGGQIG